VIKDKNIVCISSIDWDFLWQGHQEIMTRFARNGNRVLFIENTGVRAPRIRDLGRIRSRIANWRKGVHGIRKIEEGLYVYSPIVLPFPYLRIARFINKKLIFAVLFKWLKTVNFSEPIVWTFLPTGLSIDLINKIDPAVLIYYCIDSFQASSKDARKVKKTEETKAEEQNAVDDLEVYRRNMSMVAGTRRVPQFEQAPFPTVSDRLAKTLYLVERHLLGRRPPEVKMTGPTSTPGTGTGTGTATKKPDESE